MPDKIQAAAREYIARRDRHTHPDGDFDSAGRWYPAESEACACCDSVRSPSRSWPYSLLVHCRSLAHVAALHGVEPLALRRAARELDAQRVGKVAA